MKLKQFLPLLVLTLLVVRWREPPRVSSQQSPACANEQTAGQTEKQQLLADCSCQQVAAQDKPTYRVGAAPFGRTIAPRVGTSARVGARPSLRA